MPARLIFCFLLLISFDVLSEEKAPSVEFLEFLGIWENKQGEWLDPTQFIEIPDLLSTDATNKEVEKDE